MGGSQQQTLTVLGSTGSIGTQTLDLVTRHPDRFKLHALTAHSKIEVLAGQCRRLRPQFAVVGNADFAAELKLLLGTHTPTKILHGKSALEEVSAAAEVTTVVAGIVGAAGLQPILAAARSGKRILIANKEPLIMTGPLLLAEAARSGAVLIPTDSEHNAIFQCLPRDYARDPAAHGVSKIILTASGGPFRSWTPAQMAKATPDQACAHPTWTMGRKISVDSATLMNKALEVIEAHYLFGLPPEQIDVVIHPQSIIHSMVAFADGSTLAQMGTPDMRTPIANALAWPERISAGVPVLDLVAKGTLTFEAPDRKRFPALQLGYDALKAGGTAPAILSAANEVAIEHFLAKRCHFDDITRIVSEVLAKSSIQPADRLETVLAADGEARRRAADMLKLAA